MPGFRVTATRRFDEVRDLLDARLACGEEIGASLYVSLAGEEVVDLWGGWRDRKHSAPWSEHTTVAVFSATKIVTSVVVLMPADRGLIDIDAPVARYWPEFAQNGKGECW